MHNKNDKVLKKWPVPLKTGPITEIVESIVPAGSELLAPMSIVGGICHVTAWRLKFVSVITKQGEFCQS